MKNKYRIVRFFRDGRSAELVKTVATVEEAKEHCSSPDTRGTLEDGTAWFDGYTEA